MAFLCNLLLVCSLSVARCAPVPLEMIDMTHPFDNSTLGWPTQKKFQIVVKENGTQREGQWVQSEEYAGGSHVGTHLDAPCHFNRRGWCVDDVPFSRLVAPAAVVDVTRRSRDDADYLVRVRDLEGWERETGESLNGTIVLMRSGWGRKWPDKEAFTGTAGNRSSQLHFPGLSKEAAQWLVDKRNIFGLGTETLSLDGGQSRDMSAHRTLLGKNVFGLENVANMEDIPIYGATLHVFPMKIGRASGAPVRIVATYPKMKYAKKEEEYGTEGTLREIIIFNK
ncbi:hypothetical protein JTE90_002377 [Oedothorax gibbosus]|uniref:Cyclase n=1 Tax=Oedothorax gibbosus TaxID=931172 RepID=A0AAV6VBY3_9ARAC|nr:hypothetical protein JTE90_002377 [Oedothorax gibbosus]